MQTKPKSNEWSTTTATAAVAAKRKKNVFYILYSKRKTTRTTTAAAKKKSREKSQKVLSVVFRFFLFILCVCISRILLSLRQNFCVRFVFQLFFFAVNRFVDFVLHGISFTLCEYIWRFVIFFPSCSIFLLLFSFFFIIFFSLNPVTYVHSVSDCRSIVLIINFNEDTEW